MKLRTSFRREAAPEDLARLAEGLSKLNAGDGRSTQEDGEKPYQPFRLMGRKIVLSDETLGAISQFEMLASRCDCLIGISPLGPALARIMARMDGVFIAHLNGAPADYRVCCYLDYLKEAGIWTHGSPDPARLESLGLELSPPAILDASRCAHQMTTIEVNSLCGAAPATITPGHVLALHQAISRTFHPKAPAGLRSWDIREEGGERGDTRAYRPPTAHELPVFLQDLVAFLNESKLGPSAKVALMHYQMEATKMFASDIEQLARALLVGIWRNTGLIKHIMPPIAITPALAQRNHDEVLQPYQFRSGACETIMIDEWVYHTACASRNAFEVAQCGYALACRAVEQWERSLADAGYRVTDTVRRFLVTVIGTPVFSAPFIAESIDTTFATATKLITASEAAGIVAQVSRGRRNKVYECPAATGLFDAILEEAV